MERRLRLRTDSEFRRTRAAGRSWSNGVLTVGVVANELEHNRYGFVVSKRVGNAVTRNLLKRRLREVLRELEAAGRLGRGVDLAFVARPALVQLSFEELRSSVLGLLARARLLQPERTAAQPDGTERPEQCG